MRRKININYILVACVVILMVLCFLSIHQPLHFQSEQAKRETIVKDRLMKIRAAEEKYRRTHGVYTGSFDILIKGKYIADTLQYIPFADGKKFTLSATTIVGKSGKQIPLMECGAGYADYLYGLDEDAIQLLINDANYTGNYPGLKIGDITTDNDNAGNW